MIIPGLSARQARVVARPQRSGAVVLACLAPALLLLFGLAAHSGSDGSSSVLWSMAQIRTGTPSKPFTCDCSWTGDYACPGTETKGAIGVARDDSSLCFYHCCPKSCAFWDLAGQCLKEKEPEAVPYAEALRDPKGFDLTNIDLGNDCDEGYLLSQTATMVTKLIGKGIESMKMPMHLDHFLPPGTDMHVRTVNGAILVLENVTVSRITPTTLKCARTEMAASMVTLNGVNIS